MEQIKALGYFTQQDPNQDQKQDKPTQENEKDIIQSYIKTNELCSPLWLEYYDLGMSMATYKGLPDAYEKATGTITYHIQRIATHILCYFFKHLQYIVLRNRVSKIKYIIYELQCQG